MSTPNIVEFVTDPQLLGLSVSLAQETLLRGLYGLPLPSQDHRDVWHLCTGGRAYSEGHAFPEATVVSGARGGKDSRIAAPALCYEASFGGHEVHLGRGERATIPLVSQDARANAVARGYVFGYMRESPVLRALIADEKRDELILTNRTAVLCLPNTAGSLRAWSMPAAGLNEVAFWRLEGGIDSDVEIQAALRRGMVGFPRTVMLKTSTPYMKSGLLHADFARAFGKDDPDLLVWRATSQLMNPSLTSTRMDREKRLDPARFAREYEAEFLDDIASFVPPSWVDDAVITGRHELPPRSGVLYFAATDPSGGGADAWPLLIAHVEGEDDTARLVVDVLRSHRRVGIESPDLDGVARDFATVLRRYGCDAVVGDKYAGAWVRQAFERCGIQYDESPCDRSAAYLELLPWLAQGRVELLDDARLVRELKTLERRPKAGGRDTVDHPKGQHDDHANVLALAAVLATRQSAEPPLMLVGSPSYLAWESAQQARGGWPDPSPDDDGDDERTVTEAEWAAMSDAEKAEWEIVAELEEA
jgi:hypothetical protein